MEARRKYHVGDLRGRLIREARAMLDEGGLKPLNLRALAARAGITAASMYHHFDSKTALLAELAAGGFQELRRELEAADGPAAAEGRRLRGWATAYFRFALREPALFALMFDPEIAEQPQVAPARATVLAVLQRVVEEVAAAQGRFGNRLDQITLAVWAAAHGAATLNASAPGEDQLIDQVIAGLEVLFRPVQPPLPR